MGFWIDEATKSLRLADGTPFIIRRFDDRWISAARPGEAGDKTELDWVFAGYEDNGDCRGGRLGRKRGGGTPARCDHGDPSANQFGRPPPPS